MKLKLLYLISATLLISAACLQADLIRAPNEKINAMVSPNDPEKSVASTGWHYTIKNNTKQDILGFMRLEAKGGVQAPFNIKPYSAIDLYTLRGKDYEFNPDVLGEGVSITKEGAIAAAIVPATAAVSATTAAAIGTAATAAAATAAAMAASSAAETAAASAAADVAFDALPALFASASGAAIGAGVTAAAAAVAAAIMGGVWGAEVDPTHITVWWNEAPNRARKYTFVLNASSNLGAILAGNHELEFYTPNRNNELRLKIDGTPLPMANILQDKEIV